VLKRCLECLKADVERERLVREQRRAAKLKAGPLYPPPGRRKLCGAHARSTGKPCKATATIHGRCRHHGGIVGDPGPKTIAGKAKVTENLRNTPSWKRRAELAAQSVT
jgi:hypothetical protein